MVSLDFADNMTSPKTEIPNGMGHYARFNDSEGNIIGIWSQN